MTAPAHSNPFRPLVHRNFRIFWSGQTLSLIGTWMQSVGEGWLALQLSNSALMVGIVAGASSLPVLLLSLYGGVVADRHDKLKLVRIAQSLLLVQASVLWWFTATNHLTIHWLIILATANGIISAFEIPARQSFIVELVGREDLVDAIALNSAGFNLARVIGPTIAAIVIGTLGAKWCFGLNALSYLAVLAGLFMIRVPVWQRVQTLASPLEGLLEGFRYMRDTPLVNVLVRVVAVNAIFGMPFLAMMPVVARNILHSGAGGYGVLLTCVGIGALAGALSLSTLGQRVPRGWIFILSSYGFAGGLIVFSLMHVMLPAALMLIIVGFSMMLSGALANGLMQSIAPDELRGRVVSAYVFVAVGLVPIGSFISGALARYVGVDWAIGGCAVVVLAYSSWIFTRTPALRTVR
ncbi:MAG: MFS transporter [Gemmatimonadota bacterium]|nr:MFS transporter [Gemmatimonadota bacterium]